MDQRQFIQIDSRDLTENNYVLAKPLHLKTNEAVFLEKISIKNNNYQVKTGFNSKIRIQTKTDPNAGFVGNNIIITPGTYTQTELALEFQTQLNLIATPVGNPAINATFTYNTILDRMVLTLVGAVGTDAININLSSASGDPYSHELIGFTPAIGYLVNVANPSINGTTSPMVNQLDELFFSVKFQEQDPLNFVTSEIVRKNATFSYPVGSSVQFSKWFHYLPFTKTKLADEDKTKTIGNITITVRDRFETLSDIYYRVTFVIGSKTK